MLVFGTYGSYLESDFSIVRSVITVIAPFTWCLRQHCFSNVREDSSYNLSYGK